MQLYVVFKGYAVNWPKLHGNKPIIAKKIKMKKNRAQHFLEPPQGTYINFLDSYDERFPQKVQLYVVFILKNML